jgi:hypothetical protein
MRAPVDKNNDLFLFPEGLPCTQAEQFRSECPPDKKTKVEDLFQFSRGRGDLHISIIAACLALFFFAMFFTQTGWDNRKLPDGVASYLAHQFGLIDLDGKITRFGRILKQSWVAPYVLSDGPGANGALELACLFERTSLAQKVFASNQGQF